MKFEEKSLIEDLQDDDDGETLPALILRDLQGIGEKS
jgi:hypothetical protein